MTKAIDRLDLVYRRFLGAACVLFFAVMIAAIGGQVVMRYVFNNPLSWSEELARFSMIWLAMLASALCARFGQHIALTSFVPLPAKAKVAVDALIVAIVVVVLCLLVYHSWDLTSRASGQTTPGLGMSMSYAYAAIPAGSLLMIVGLALGWARSALPSRSAEGEKAAATS